MTTSSMVLFLAVASNVFGAIFARLGSASVITNALTALPVPPFVTLLIVMVLIFLLGWPFEWPAIIFVFMPIFYPVIEALKYDMLWFGALVAVNLQTAYLSPPVAMSAYYLKQVVPKWSLGTIYRGMADFMVIQVIALLRSCSSRRSRCGFRAGCSTSRSHRRGPGRTRSPGDAGLRALTGASPEG